MRHALALACWISLLLAPAAAEDFRIETKVFAGKGKAPVSENITLFQAGYVYDYLSDPERVAVFDKPHGRFILLDPERKMKVEVKTEDVLIFSKKVHDLAAQNSDPFKKFAAHPDFEKNFSQDGLLTLKSKFITYRLQTMPAETPEAAQQYRDFSDWYARFNSMSNPGSTPPQARLAVNEELGERGLLPTEVQLTISPTGNRPITMRSEHHVSWRLLETDIERIAATANQLATFKTADLAELVPKATAKR